MLRVVSVSVNELRIVLILYYKTMKLEKVQWISIPLQIGDPTRQVAQLFPYPDIAIADQKLSFRTIEVISAYIISLVFSNSRKRSLRRRLPTDRR